MACPTGQSTHSILEYAFSRKSDPRPTGSFVIFPLQLFVVFFCVNGLFGFANLMDEKEGILKGFRLPFLYPPLFWETY
jgi:hypothetical protein